MLQLDVLLLDADFWRWQPHPEVWLVVGVVVTMGFYVSRVIAPKVQGDITNRQRGFFVAGVVVLWLASDWPMHDVAEEYLYLVHMVQHLLFTLIMPALFLLAVPTWLARLLVGSGRVPAVLRRLSRPVVAGVLFNAVAAITHWSTLVNASVEIGPLHYFIHFVMVATAFLMWVPVCGPFPELRMSLPGQMVYLFVMSIIPTVPGGWLTFAESPVYNVYNHGDRLWNIGVIADQQAAGVIMKIGGGLFLWSLITYLFFVWAGRHEEANRQGRILTEPEIQRWEELADELGPSTPSVEDATPRV